MNTETNDDEGAGNPRPGPPPPPPDLSAAVRPSRQNGTLPNTPVDRFEFTLPPRPPRTLDLPDQTHRRRRRRPEPRTTRERLARKWRRWRRRRAAVKARRFRPRNIILAAAAVAALLVIGMVVVVYSTLAGIRRVPLIPLDAATPSIGTNIVLLGSDHPAGALDLDPKTLIVQLIHISADRHSAQVINLPRNLVLGAKESDDTLATIYQHSETQGLIGALQKRMGLRVDHVIQASFSGYIYVTDDLGGVNIETVANSATSSQVMNGPQTHAWASATNLPGGTLETGRRYQEWSKSLLTGALRPGTVLNPFTAWSVFKHTTGSIVVDNGFDSGAMISLTWSLRSLSPSDFHFYGAPQTGPISRGGSTVLRPDPTAFTQLGTAIRTDNLASLGLFQQ